MGLVNIKNKKKNKKEGFSLPGKSIDDVDKTKDGGKSVMDFGGGMDSAMDSVNSKPDDSSTCRGNCTTNNWWGFLMGCLYYLVYVLMLGMIGANFIFFATLPQGTADVPGPTLDDFFPTYITQYLVFDDPYGPLPQKINDACLNEIKDVKNKWGKDTGMEKRVAQREGPCYEAAMTSIRKDPWKTKDSQDNQDGLVTSHILAAGGWTSYYRVETEYKLAGRRVQKELKDLLKSRFSSKKVGGGVNENHITPQDLMQGLKEEAEHFMKEEQVGKVGINPTTDKPIPLPPFKNEAIGNILDSIAEVVEASKFQPLLDPKITADFKMVTEKMQKINIGQMAQAQAQASASGMGMGMGMGMGSSMSPQSAVQAAQAAAKDQIKFKVEQERVRKALKHMAERQTLIIKLQQLLEDAINLGGDDVAGAVGVLLSQELVEVSKEELSGWKKCLTGWEKRANALCPYFVETGGGQCATRAAYKNFDVASGAGLSSAMQSNFKIEAQEKKAAAAAKAQAAAAKKEAKKEKAAAAQRAAKAALSGAQNDASQLQTSADNAREQAAKAKATAAQYRTPGAATLSKVASGVGSGMSAVATRGRSAASTVGRVGKRIGSGAVSAAKSATTAAKTSALSAAGISTKAIEKEKADSAAAKSVEALDEGPRVGSGKRAAAIRKSAKEVNNTNLTNEQRNLHLKTLQAHMAKNEAVRAREKARQDKFRCKGVLDCAKKKATFSAAQAYAAGKARDLDSAIANSERGSTRTAQVGRAVGKGAIATAKGLGAAAMVAGQFAAMAQQGGGEQADGQQAGGQSGGSYNRHCHYRSAQMMEGLMNAAITSNLKQSWPYNMWVYPGSAEFATWGPAPTYDMQPGIAYAERPSPWSWPGIKNWFARMIAGNYCFMRGLVVQVMNVFGRENDAAKTAINSDTTLMFISWLNLMFVSVIGPIISMLSTFGLAYNSFWMFAYRKDPKSMPGKEPWKDATAMGGCCKPPYSAMQKAKKLAQHSQSGGDTEALIDDVIHQLGGDSDSDSDSDDNEYLEGGGFMDKIKAARAAAGEAGKALKAKGAAMKKQAQSKYADRKAAKAKKKADDLKTIAEGGVVKKNPLVKFLKKFFKVFVKAFKILWKWIKSSFGLISYEIGCLVPRPFGSAKYGSAGILITLMSTFLGIMFSMSFGPLLGLWQTAQYLITFFIYPAMIAPGIIGDIIKCNAELLAIIYGMLMLEVASRTLTPKTCGMMGFVWLMIVIRAIIKAF